MSQPVQPLGQISQTLSGLPPLPQNKMQLGLQPYAQDSRVSTGVPIQYSALENFSTQTQIQRPQLAQNQVLQQSQSGVNPHPSIHPQSLGGQQIPLPASHFNQQMHHNLSQNAGPVPPINAGYNAVPRSQTVGINPQFSAVDLQVRNLIKPDKKGVWKSKYSYCCSIF